MVPVERNRNFRILVSDEERAMVQALADRDGLTAADAVRLLIRRAYTDAFPNKPPTPKRTKR